MKKLQVIANISLCSCITLYIKKPLIIY